ncbi:MAG TPA: hypothetical protein ACFE0H_15630 [Elainellaceae cyanobacterium]
MLKLLGHPPDYRSPLSALTLTNSLSDRNRACRQLCDRGFIDCFDEVIKFRTALPGKALLKLDAKNLPITDIELSVLQAGGPGYTTPGNIANVPKDTRQILLKDLADRGLIQVETQVKAVWLTTAGKLHLYKDYVPQGNATISLGLVGNYLQFMRQFDVQSVSVADEVSSLVGSSKKPDDADILTTIQTLDHELGTENYLPLFYLRQTFQPLLSRDQLDEALYRLQRRDQIELSSLQDAIAYTPEQIDAGIPQDIGGPLFFISVLTP